ncbi:hypothetical protein [Roseivirga sp. E12]|uniref:hypothetical protein n=1 Tax=Roseivirga sp. E12 TaxID=2819237 RepID=UPI001ABC5B80|nr:hypothetical protein [Roseivirga sp. E12]MBO3700597.1 hypothetical protein [Roseivirga sp. E12]
MKKQITKAVAAIVLLASGFLVSANESEREISLSTENQKAVVLKMNNIKAGTQISLRDENGKLLFEDKADANQYGKVFNLSLLEKGQLQLEIENEETLEIMAIEVTESSASIMAGSEKVFQKPIVKHNGESMKIYFGEGESGMKITVLDQYGDVAFKDKVEAGSALKRYDVSKLSGKYNIQFTADGRSFYHTITLD